MSTTQLTDVIVPAQFTDYLHQNLMERTALVASGIMASNQAITDQLRVGAHSFTVPFWRDLGNEEANRVNDDPDDHSTPLKIQAGRQVVRKSYLHQSWSAMNLASELAGDDALDRIQERVTEYWNRQAQRRLMATLNGILADNVANDGGDMVMDISSEAGDAANFSPEAVIDACGTLGDAMDSVVGIALHSVLYRRALKADLIEFVQPSAGSMRLPTYRGLAVIVDDGMPEADDVYTCVLFGHGGIGYGSSPPNIAQGTEVENLPSAGQGGGQQILHSRVHLAVHPLGFRWTESAVAGESPSIAELATAANWDRSVERKAVPLAFLKCK